MSITFTYDITVVTIGDKEVGEDYSRKSIAQQAVYDTDADTRVVYDFAADHLEFEVNLENLTTTEKTNIYNFWYTTVSKQAKEWVFKDSLNRSYDVRFNSEEFDPLMQNGGERWNLRIMLRGNPV